MNDQFLKNRKIKIDISTNNSGGDRDRRGGFGDRGGRMDNNRQVNLLVQKINARWRLP